MANVRTNLVALLGVAACGGGDKGGNGSPNVDAATGAVDAPADSKTFTDAPAPVYDFSCMGNAAPTQGAGTLALSGSAQELALQGATPTNTPVQTAGVALCSASATTCNNPGTGLLDVATTDSNGNFAINYDNDSGTPLDVHFRMSKGGVRTTLVYPAAPLLASQANIPIVALSSGVMSALGVACGHSDTDNALIALVVTDCADDPITDAENLTITIKQNNATVSGVSVFGLGTLSAQAAGTYFVCNVPSTNATFAAATTIAASYKGMPLRERTVKILTGGTTATIVRPGY